MKEHYFLCGMPRAGNTVISAIMNQDKRICFTANSILCDVLFNLENIKKENAAFKNFPDHKSYNNILKNVFNNYYSHWHNEIIIDRGPWGTVPNLKLIKKYITKKPKFIVLYRSFWECLNSFLVLERPQNIEKTCDYYINNSSSILIQNFESIKNIINNNEEHVFIKYEDFIKSPQKQITNLYKFLNLKPKKIKLNNFKEFSSNNIKYNDKEVGYNLHKINTNKIMKTKKIKLIPKSVLMRYGNIDLNTNLKYSS